MELELRHVDYDASIYQVIKAFEEVLHGPDLFDPNDKMQWPKGRPPNFRVELNKSEAGGVGHNGTGRLTLHSRRFGARFQHWLSEDGNCVKVLGKKIYIPRRSKGVSDSFRDMLEKSIYVGKLIRFFFESLLEILTVSLCGVGTLANEQAQRSKRPATISNASYLKTV